MKTRLKIDFVSDIVCPWCVIGLRSLEAALRGLADTLTADIHFQPFELNPDMPAGGENLAERVARKFGRGPEEMAQMRAQMQARAAEVGFEMVHRPDARIYNTFDAHRLLHWAGLEGRQGELQHALFDAYFTRGEAIDDPQVLTGVAQRAELPVAEARAVLSSGRFTDEVRAGEQRWRALGINSVPTIVVNSAYVISGAHPAETFARALGEIASEAA